MMKKFYLPIVLFTFLLTACTSSMEALSPSITPIPILQSTASWPVTPSPTATPEPKGSLSEPATPDPFARVAYEQVIELSQAIGDGKLKAAVDEKGAVVRIVDGAGQTLEPNQAGYYFLGDNLFAWNSGEGKLVPAFEANGGNLKVWDDEKGRYTQVFVNTSASDPNHGIKAHELVSTDLGIVAEYKGKADGLIDPETGEVAYLPFGTTIADSGMEFVWDAEADGWTETTRINGQGQVERYNKERGMFAPFVDSYGNTLMATERIDADGGWLFVNNGTLTGSLDKQGNVTAAENDMVPVGFKVFSLENGQPKETGLQIMQWIETRQDYNEWDLSHPGAVPISVSLIQSIFGQDRYDLQKNHDGVALGMEKALMDHMNFQGTKEEFRTYLQNGGVLKIALNAWNLRTGELIEIDQNTPYLEVNEIVGFFNAAEPQKFGAPVTPKTMYKVVSTTTFSRGYAYDPLKKILYSCVASDCGQVKFSRNKSSFHELDNEWFRF